MRKEINEHSFQIPDLIEKISCDAKCLYGTEPRSLPATTSKTFSSMNVTTSIFYLFLQLILRKSRLPLQPRLNHLPI